jgi:hypothetical protein
MSKDDQLHALQSMAVLLLLQAEAPETAARNGASQFLETIMVGTGSRKSRPDCIVDLFIAELDHADHSARTVGQGPPYR